MSQIIIGVPGTWESRSEIVQAIASRSNGYLFAGGVLMNTATQQSQMLEVEEYNLQLHGAFRIAGQGNLSEEDISLIGEHTFTLYALSSGASLSQVRESLEVGNALLNSGGIAVKVESAGVAHSAEKWRQLAESDDLFSLYVAFITLIGSENTFYSCGMHNFGLPDCEVENNLSPEAAADLLNQFNYYQLAESPDLASGNTFSLSADSPTYTLTKEKDRHHHPGEPFHNPFGIWSIRSARKKGFFSRFL